MGARCPGAVNFRQRTARELQGRRLMQGAAARQVTKEGEQEYVGVGACAAAGHAERSVAEAAKRADSVAWCSSRVEVGVGVSVQVLAAASVFWFNMTHCR